MPRKSLTWARIGYQKKPTRAKRKCLCCSRMFMSEWIGNRMCEPCKAVDKVTEHVLDGVGLAADADTL